MIDFSTLVDDGHVWHRSLAGTPLRIQANATFAHRLDWFDHCSFCAEVVATHKASLTLPVSPPSDEAPKREVAA